MNCSVRFGNCFLRVALMYQPCCLLPCCQGEAGELAKKLLSKPQKQFILSLGNYLMMFMPKTQIADIGGCDGNNAGGGGELTVKLDRRLPL